MDNRLFRKLSAGNEKNKPENSRRVKTLNIILSVVLAVILWAYVIGEVNPETEKTLEGVPLNIVGEKTLESQGLVVITEFEDVISAVIKGRRSEIYGMTANRLSARIDVSDCAEGENQVSVKVTAPSNIEEAVAVDGDMVVVVDRLVTEKKPVDVVVSGELRDGCEMDITEMSRSSVEVSGPSTYVDKVDSVVGVLKVKEGQQDYSQEISLIAVDRDGKAVKGVEIEEPSVNIQAVKTLVKSFEVKVNYTGTPAEGISLVMPDSAPISLKGKYEDITGIDSIETETVDVSGITEDTYVNAVVKIPAGAAVVDSLGKPVEGQADGTVVIKVEIKVNHTDIVSDGEE
ncbi:MAG: CdaR family protein [Bacillota bacterium]|nr:CdaR family protein [Bacillota bacterium]